MKNFLKCLLGAFLIGFSLNMFIVNYYILPPGLYGLCALYSYKTGIMLALTILLINLCTFAYGYLFLPHNKIKKSFWPVLLIPLMAYLTAFITPSFDITSSEKILICIYGGFLIGLGYKLIYSANMMGPNFDVVTEVLDTLIYDKSIYIPYIIEFLIMIVYFKIYGLELTMYSVITVFIAEVFKYKARVGVSNSKVFYIITKKEKELQRLLINEFHLGITIFDVKGGFSKNKSWCIMSVVPTKKYYKIRERIMELDSEAFITITDSFESINSD